MDIPPGNLCSTKTFMMKRQAKHYNLDMTKFRGYWLGKHLSQAHKKKLSIALTGRVMTPEHRRKIGLKSKGRKKSKETIAKLKKARARQIITPESKLKRSRTMKGRPFTPEHIWKMTLARRTRKDKPLSEEHKKNIGLGVEKAFKKMGGHPFFKNKMCKKYWDWEEFQRSKVYCKKTRDKMSQIRKEFIEKNPQYCPPFWRTNPVSLPEWQMRTALKIMKIDFELYSTLKGHPDIFIKPNICIFCDGSFWHGKKLNKINKKIKWRKNIIKTKKRDIEVNKFLKSNKYNVIRFWDREIHKDITHCIEKIILVLEKI